MWTPGQKQWLNRTLVEPSYHNHRHDGQDCLCYHHAWPSTQSQMDSYKFVIKKNERKYSNGLTVCSETHMKHHLNRHEWLKVCGNAGIPQTAMSSFVSLGKPSARARTHHTINKHTKNIFVQFVGRIKAPLKLWFFVLWFGWSWGRASRRRGSRDIGPCITSCRRFPRGSSTTPFPTHSGRQLVTEVDNKANHKVK